MGLRTCAAPAPAAGLEGLADIARTDREGCPFLRSSRCPFLRSWAFFRGGDSGGWFHRLEKLEISGPDAGAGARAALSGDGSAELPSGHRIKPANASALEQLRLSGPDRYTRAKSVIMVLGLSVHTASVELREKLAVPEAEWPGAITELCGHNHIEEAAVLSTCNRMEIYVVALSWHRGLVEVLDWMSKRSGIAAAELREHLFVLRDRDACQHLFRVSSGLDSLVLGEGQILSQVKQVFKTGQGSVGFGRHLNGLFKQAITAGKRVRAETSISAGAVSVSSAAVELAVLKLSKERFALARVLVVGAGKMAKLLVKHLVSKGSTKMVVVNRSEQRVLELQAEFPEVELQYEPLARLMSCASEADLIFTSTAAYTPLFLKEDVEQLPPASTHVGGTRHFVDIAVPRNVCPCVSGVPSTRLFNVDDLEEVVAANKEDRRRKAQEAQVLIDNELQNFESWRDSLETVPTIKRLRAYAERIRSSEVNKCLSRLSEDVPKKDRQLVEELSRSIINKLLHGPMQHLRTDGSDGRTVTDTIENMHALERMFDLQANFSSIEQQLRSQMKPNSQ